MVVPAANVLGFFRNDHREAGIDPNRDFPYDSQTPGLCFQTIAARTMNEVYHNDLIQSSLIFQSSITPVGHKSATLESIQNSNPGRASQDGITATMSKYSGSIVVNNTELLYGCYRYEGIAKIAQYARGSMNDWAYASSWDNGVHPQYPWWIR